MDKTKADKIIHLQNEAGEAKRRLLRIKSQLEAIGAIRRANSLARIIGELEYWQTRKVV